MGRVPPGWPIVRRQINECLVQIFDAEENNDLRRMKIREDKSFSFVGPTARPRRRRRRSANVSSLAGLSSRAGARALSVRTATMPALEPLRGSLRASLCRPERHRRLRCKMRGTPVSAPQGFRPDESAHRPRPGRSFMRRRENLAAGPRRSRTFGSATRGLRGDGACRGWSDGEAEEGKGHGANFHRWRGPEPTREACRDIMVRWLNAAEAAELPASRNIARTPGRGPRSQGPAPLSASVAPLPVPSRVPSRLHGHTTTRGRP